MEPINRDIYNTIVSKRTNEFAIYNNGITMLSDETLFSEKIGKKDKAILIVKNPQIINGGQTAYTLSRILTEARNEDEIHTLFDGKEVLLKVITTKSDIKNENKIDFIQAISDATNKQIQVTYADRHSNDIIQHRFQREIYGRFGMFYERKRGEFNDGLTNRYIGQNQLIGRKTFTYIALACNGFLEISKPKNVFKKPSRYNEIYDLNKLDLYLVGINVYYYLHTYPCESEKPYYYALKYGLNGLIYIITSKYVKLYGTNIDTNKIKNISNEVISSISKFEQYAISLQTNTNSFKKRKMESGLEPIITTTNLYRYYKSTNAKKDLEEFFK